MDGEWKVLSKKQDWRLDDQISTAVDDAILGPRETPYIYTVQAPDGSVHKVRANSEEELRRKISAGEFEE